MTPAAAGLPLRLGPVRRTRLLGADAVSSTWEGWEGWRGVRVRLRVLAADHRDDPAAHARIHAAAGAPARLAVDEIDDGWPRVVSAPLRRTLADLLPWDDFSDPVAAVRVLGGIAASLAGLHAAGHAHGAVDPEHVVLDDDGWKLLWLGPAAGVPAPDPAADLRALGHLAAGLTHPDDPVGSVCAAFIDYPPPSAADAGRLLASALGASLAAERHGLVRRHRSFDRRSRVTRLRLLAARLAAHPPPPARGCVRADGGTRFLVASDGVTVFGGPVEGDGPELVGLPAVAGAGEVDVAAVRAVLRAARAAGDPAERDRLTTIVGGTPAEVDRLVRWLDAAARLRTDRRILAARA